jgi:hypothetical protein
MQNLTVPQWDDLPALSWKEKIAFLTFQFLKLPQTQCPVMHSFENGFYVRRMNIPAGTLFLGRAHKVGHECVLESGSVIQVLPDNKILFDAPHAVHTVPGFHMVVYALTDVVGVTIHENPKDLRDVDLLEAEIFEPLSTLTALGEEVAARHALLAA